MSFLFIFPDSLVGRAPDFDSGWVSSSLAPGTTTHIKCFLLFFIFERRFLFIMSSNYTRDFPSVLDVFNPFDLFDFDRHFYFFNRDEKDMHPYDVIRKKESLVLTHNVLGIAKKDLKVSVRTENLKHYLVIEGSSKDEITGKSYSINSRFSYDPTEVDVSKAESELKNGILYITIPYKVKEDTNETGIRINIK